MLILPFTSDPARTFSVQLGSVGKFQFDVRYNDRSSSWTFDLTSEPDGTLLLAGVPMLIGQGVLAPYGLGIGDIVFSDLSGAGLDAGPDDMGDRVQGVWLNPAQVSALADAGVPM